MRIKNKKYNNYLKALMKTQGRTLKKSLSSKQMAELGYINSHIKRYYENDRFERAVFKTFNGFKYEITAKAEIFKITKDGKKPIKPHVMSNLSTTYTALRYMVKEDGKQHNIPMHLLMMVAAYKNFYEVYSSNIEYRVNHTFIASDDAERTLDYDAFYNLELVTHQQNLRHGHFVHRYGLYNIHIEAEDCDILESKLIKLDDNMCDSLRETVIQMNKDAVNMYYVKKGWNVWVEQF